MKQASLILTGGIVASDRKLWDMICLYCSSMNPCYRSFAPATAFAVHRKGPIFAQPGGEMSLYHLPPAQKAG